LRVVTALAALAVFSLVTKTPLKAGRADIWRLWVIGFFSQALPFALLFSGEVTISAGLAGILNGTTPIWTLVLGATVFGGLERFTARKVSGVLLGLLGVILIFLPSLRESGVSGQTIGALYVLIAASCYGTGILLTRKLMTREGGVSLRAGVFHQHVAAAAMLLLGASVMEGPSAVFEASWDGPFITAVLYLGVLSTAAAFLIFFRLIRNWGASEASAVTYLIPFFALVIDWLVFGHLPVAIELLGAAVVLISVVMVREGSGKSVAKP